MGIYNQDDNGPSGGGFGKHILLAIVIALFGLITYMWQVQENPVTGQKQHVSLSPSEEIALGLASAPQMANKMGGELSEDDSRSKEVKKIGRLIVTNTDAKKSPVNR